MSKAVQAQAFIAFLRCEAKVCEAKAASFRETANTIETNYVDGQKKKRKRVEDDSEVSQGLSGQTSKKEGISGYMLFYRENYELIKKSKPTGAPERDTIAEVAAQWTNISNEEKLAWKFRAEELNKADQLLNQRTNPAAAAADQTRGGAKTKGGKKEVAA